MKKFYYFMLSMSIMFGSISACDSYLCPVIANQEPHEIRIDPPSTKQKNKNELLPVPPENRFFYKKFPKGVLGMIQNMTENMIDEKRTTTDGEKIYIPVDTEKDDFLIVPENCLENFLIVPENCLEKTVKGVFLGSSVLLHGSFGFFVGGSFGPVGAILGTTAGVGIGLLLLRSFEEE